VVVVPPSISSIGPGPTTLDRDWRHLVDEVAEPPRRERREGGGDKRNGGHEHEQHPQRRHHPSLFDRPRGLPPEDPKQPNLDD
jgi:hypothetical protein